MPTATIEIKKGWFYSAGSRWGWKADGLDILGVGIKRSYLMQEGDIKIKIEGVTYSVNCAEAREFVNKYHSFYEMAGGTVVGVVSKSILDQEAP